ncbi:putative polypeptide N-acetylgalactosaminyltransferase 10 [Drosophila eugracilis]|uniref:putative polypeptide N-acetylgalactosaminyltransferase 10 n=1 Tax=Drosophila eugracilis TaxID=29029 RepID=UPI0007E62473|nr:putative polypeptide N-acetylgalactosaminyltransferase 10 [Drosophila eugracilis]
MNVDLKFIVRLLLAVLFCSLISTILMGNQIHRRIVDTVVDKINQKEVGPKTTRQLSNRQIPREISSHIASLSQNELDVLKIQRHVKFSLPKQEAVKNWHDPLSMNNDKVRIGLGEQGTPAELPNAKEMDVMGTYYGDHGFNAKLSDHISLKRALPDIRPLGCHNQKYLQRLPNVTVIIAFHNERLSVLLRSVTSIINRSPPELLKQIVLVDGDSELMDLGPDLEDFVAPHSKLIKILRLTGRHGLSKARVEGAKIATCQVLVFLDSHIEVNTNWLPPLLEPIVVNRNIVTGPILDKISDKTFEYTKSNSLTRSGFNWLLKVKELPVFPEDEDLGFAPYRTPLLVGPMAIDKNFFWNLGGYDEGQFEMSFKIWMCGGMSLYVPCSRVGHINKAPVLPKSRQRNYNSLARNNKRVAEVWMDEYKKHLYDSNPELYKKTNPGSLTKLKTLRKTLKCKSFDWYMNKVAPDFLEKYPVVDLPIIFSGAIESVAFPGFCVDSLDRKHKKPVVLSRCTGNSTNPSEFQNWFLTRNYEIRLTKSKDDCLEAQGIKTKSVWLFHCHGYGGNQYWLYNRRYQWFQQGQMWVWCLEANLTIGQEVGQVLSNNVCNENNAKQQWKLGKVQFLRD